MKKLNKEIVIKTTLKKEIIKSAILSVIFSAGISYMLFMAINFGIKMGSQNENLKEFPMTGVLYLIPVFIIIFMCCYLGEMVGKGYFVKGGKKKWKNLYLI